MDSPIWTDLSDVKELVMERGWDIRRLGVSDRSLLYIDLCVKRFVLLGKFH